MAVQNGKYISDLPPNIALDGTELLELQKGSGVGSSQSTVLSTLAAKIGSLISNLFATAAQGEKADTAVQSVVSQSYTTVDATDPRNPKIGVSTQVAKRDVSQTFSKAQIVSPTINAAATGTVTPDASTSNTFEYAVVGNLVIANPTSAVSGQYLSILVKMGATSYTVALGANFKVMNGTSFSIVPNTANLLSGYVGSDGNIYCSISQ